MPTDFKNYYKATVKKRQIDKQNKIKRPKIDPYIPG